MAGIIFGGLRENQNWRILIWRFSHLHPQDYAMMSRYYARIKIGGLAVCSQTANPPNLIPRKYFRLYGSHYKELEGNLKTSKRGGGGIGMIMKPNNSHPNKLLLSYEVNFTSVAIIYTRKRQTRIVIGSLLHTFTVSTATLRSATSLFAKSAVCDGSIVQCSVSICLSIFHPSGERGEREGESEREREGGREGGREGWRKGEGGREVGLGLMCFKMYLLFYSALLIISTCYSPF